MIPTGLVIGASLTLLAVPALHLLLSTDHHGGSAEGEPQPLLER